LAAVWTTSVRAEEKATPPTVSEAGQQVQKHLGLYLTRPDRRDDGEQVYVRREKLEAWLLRSITAKEVEKAVCDGARWLLKGRLRASLGMGRLFESRPKTTEFSLIFYDVKTRVDPDRDGRYRQRRSVEPQARFTISRERFGQLDVESLEKALTGADCAKTARVVLDEVWVKKMKAR
jgi:hypothetical protein